MLNYFNLLVPAHLMWNNHLSEIMKFRRIAGIFITRIERKNYG
jgi:hypothetical protein